MSTQRYETADGTRYRVRWRDAHGRMHSRSFQTSRGAQGFDADVKARKFRGDVLPRPGKQTLRSAWEEWWRLIGSEKPLSTRTGYAALWNAHIKDRFDQHLLSDLANEPQLIDELVADMSHRGVGRASQRKTLMVLSGLLTQCVRWRKMPLNPVRNAPKPSAAPERAVRPLAPIVIERIRAEIQGRPTLDARPRAQGDALLVSLMSYAGLRPQEALALRWADVSSGVLTIDKAASFGEEQPTKTRRKRTVPLAAPLAEDLHEWRTACGMPVDAARVLPGRGGAEELWSDSAFRNWRKRVWRPAVKSVVQSDPNLSLLERARPYDCRASFVSLHLRAGDSPLEVARMAGHSPQVMFRHYSNVIEELVGEPRLSVDHHIARAREVLATRPDDELRELVADGLKPPSQVSEMTRLLFAPREHPRSEA